MQRLRNEKTIFRRLSADSLKEVNFNIALDAGSLMRYPAFFMPII